LLQHLQPHLRIPRCGYDPADVALRDWVRLPAWGRDSRSNRARCSPTRTTRGQSTGREKSRLNEGWWTWSGSNRRPLPCHGSALPAAPQAHSLKGRRPVFERLNHFLAVVTGSSNQRLRESKDSTRTVERNHTCSTSPSRATI